MTTLQSRRLPELVNFVGAVRAAHPEVSFTEHFLRTAYELGEHRLEFEWQAQWLLEAASELRRMISKVRGFLKRAKELQEEVARLRTSLGAAGFHSSNFNEALESMEKGVNSLLDILGIGKQDAIDQVHSARAHGFQKRWEAQISLYDLPRLGSTAAYSWFVLNADKALVVMCKRQRKPLMKTQEWAILQTILEQLFHQRAEVTAIERLVRDACKKRAAGRALPHRQSQLLKRRSS